MSKAKKFWGALRRTLAGKNKTGQVIHGVVDILPIPNFLNLYRAIEKEQPDLTFWQVVYAILRKGDTVRFLVSIPLSILVVTGYISLDDLSEFWRIVGEILKIFT